MTEHLPQGGRLYVVSTPIGNLSDITLRALETLRGVSVILAEDTRHSRQLLQRHGIDTPLVSYHEHNEARTTPRVLERLEAGEAVALISDAGTPLVSDPGARLVRAAIDAGFAVVPIPGASALLAALVTSGLDTERFTFYGFPPRKGRDRETVLGAIAASQHTSVLYEAANRLGDTLRDLAEAGAADRAAVIAREITKQFEEVRRGTVVALSEYYLTSPPKGEIVIVVSGAAPAALNESALRERARALRSDGASPRDVARALADEHGAPRNLAYRIAHE